MADDETPADTVGIARAQQGHYGLVTQFDCSKEDWIEYTERLENYFVANEVTDEGKRRAILLTAVGRQTYHVIRNLALPRSPKELSYEELVEIVATHYNPKPSPIIKRFEFNTRCQEESESIANYIAALRSIAEHCNYGDTLNDMLRDRLVCGIRDKRVQRRLLQESELSFDQAKDIALAAETANKDAMKLQQQPPKQEKEVHLVKSHKPPSSDKECHRCGGKHNPATCKYKEYKCLYCKGKGHLRAVCRKRKKDEFTDPPKSTKWVEEETEPKSDGTEYSDSLWHVSNESSKPLTVEVKLNGVPYLMELDTGASCSLISGATFEELKKRGAMLTPSTAKLCTYTGEAIRVVGSTNVQVSYEDQDVTLPLVVTEGNGPSLIGRNWLSSLRLNWKSIFTVRAQKTLDEILSNYDEVFHDDLGTLEGVTAKLHVDTSASPLFHKARPVAFALRPKIEEELGRLQSLGVIESVQFSDWAAPIVPVVKDDGSVRICGDYKVTVNRVAKVEKYPIPRIEELFASLAGGRRFSKLDLSHAYQQVVLDERSRQYVTVNTHKGLFRYNRLPFGVSSAPSIFQRLMENLLQGIPGITVYVDDICVTGRTDEEHLQHLEETLKRLKTAGMRLKRAKCEFLLSSVEYLGHVISAEGLRTSDSKVKAILKAPAPQNVADLRSFLGLVNYYAKFLPDLATVLAPLYQLLQKHKKWKWNEEQAKSFQEVKDLLKSSRVLMYFDDSLPLVLACDASPHGVGAVLSHKLVNGDERPISFASRSLTAAEQKYSQLDKEALAIIFGVKRYHQYLYGRHFELKTDHKPLTHIFSEKKGVPVMASARVQRWALILSAYSYTIQYKKGAENSNADALSRLPLPTKMNDPPRQPAEVVYLMDYLNSSDSPISSDQIRAWTDKDPVLSKVKGMVLSGESLEGVVEKEELRPDRKCRYELSVEGGCVLRGNRVVVPEKGRKQVVKMLHTAHPGIVCIRSLARSYVWWPGIDKELEDYVKSCDACQTNAKSPPSLPLHPWPWPTKPWSRVHIDYAGPFEGKMFLLIIDAYSKWVEIHMTTSSTSATTIDSLRKSFATLGVPEVVVSDNATAFTSEEFQTFLKRNGIKHVRTPPYHPASNGLVERMVQTFKAGMKKQEGSVQVRLSRFLFSYRITPQSTTGVSPSEMMLGRRIRSPLDNVRPDLSKNVLSKQEKQKSGHDVRSKPRQFSVGDSVYCKNYGSGPNWIPGVVTETMGSTMYEVELADGAKTRRHTEQLRSRLVLQDSDSQSTREQDSSDVEDSLDIVVPTDPTNPPLEQPDSNGSDDSDPGGTAESDEESGDPNTGESGTVLRRSVRVTHRPERLAETI